MHIKTGSVSSHPRHILVKWTLSWLIPSKTKIEAASVDMNHKNLKAPADIDPVKQAIQDRHPNEADIVDKTI